VDGNTRIGGGVAELSKKQVAGSVKSPKFTADKLRVSPAGDFGMDGTGRLDKRIVRQYIQRQMASIRWCYQRSFQKNPELEGKISVQFIISANGSVISSKILSSNMGDKEMDECVSGRILNWKFPAPEGGGVVKVNYPLVFRRQ
jgi:TonB family protein